MAEIKQKSTIFLLAGLIFILAIFVSSFFLASGAKADLKYNSRDILQQINQIRKQYRLSPLEINDQLTNVAEARAAVIAKEQRFSHTTIDNKTLQDFLIEADYNYQRGGENLGLSFIQADDLLTAWLQSPGHRANILTPEYTDTGLVVTDIDYHGQPTTLIVQIFGQPMEPKKQPAARLFSDDLNIFNYSWQLLQRLTLADIIVTILKST